MYIFEFNSPCRNTILHFCFKFRQIVIDQNNWKIRTKNPHYFHFTPKNHLVKISVVTKFTIGISYIWQKSHCHILVFDKIHNFICLFLTKFTFSYPCFWQNSHFHILVFDKNHFSKIMSFHKKFTLKANFSHKSLFSSIKFQESFGFEIVFLTFYSLAFWKYFWNSDSTLEHQNVTWPNFTFDRPRQIEVSIPDNWSSTE